MEDLPKLNGVGETIRHNTTGGLKAAKDGSELKRKFKADELRVKLAQLQMLLAQGKSDVDCAQAMGDGGTAMRTSQYNELKRELYRQETQGLYGKSTEDVYLEYQWAQQQCIRDLDGMIAYAKDKNNANTIVGLVRAKSDIIDKVIKMGQDMGIYNKEPEKKMVIHGHVVAKLSQPELRKLIVRETQGLAGVFTKYGDRDLMGNPIGQLTAGTEQPKFGSMEKTGLAKSGPEKAAAARKSRQVKRTKVIDAASSEV